jgi:hypothetical protein
MEFKPKGIFLTEVPPPPGPSGPSALSKDEWWELVQGATGFGPADPPSVPHGHDADFPLSSIGFDPRKREHRFDLRQDRLTHISFELKKPPVQGFASPGWLFVEDNTLAFKIKDNTLGADRFKNTTVQPGRNVVTVTYEPPNSTNNGTPPPYSYELRVEAPCWEANTLPPRSKGHMIIIVDPVIGSVEV